MQSAIFALISAVLSCSGLAFLVAADIIISTVVVDLSLESVAALAGIVFIRTLLSFSLGAEIDGRWPWQRAAAEKTDRA